MDINKNTTEKNEKKNNIYNNSKQPQIISDMNNKNNQINSNSLKIQKKSDKKRMDTMYNNNNNNNNQTQINNQRQNGPMIIKNPMNTNNPKNLNSNFNNANINNPNNIAYMGGNGGNNNNPNQPSRMEEMNQPIMYGAGKDEQQNMSPYMYYNYNNFVPYPYYPMAPASADGTFYQPIPQMPTTNGATPPNMYPTTATASPHPHPHQPTTPTSNPTPVQTNTNANINVNPNAKPDASKSTSPASIIPKNRIPNATSIATSEVGGIPTSNINNIIPVSISGAAIPPPMAATAMPGIPRMPYYQPQIPSSPLPMLTTNFNGAQPFYPSTSTHGAPPPPPPPPPPYGPLMNPMVTPSMNGGGNRYHYSGKNYHPMNKNFKNNINNNNMNPHHQNPEKFGYNGKNSQTTNNIYIRGLEPNITDESLIEMCKSWGTIVSSKAIIDNQTKECKGYGFVMYKNDEQARLAMTELNKRGYQVSFAKESFSSRLKNLQDVISTNIYMSNLPLDMTEEKFVELFAPYKVISSIILYDQTGNSRGIGLAKLESRENAQNIIDKYSNVVLPGGKNPLQVRFADSTAQKKLKGQAYHKKNKYYNNPQEYQYPRDSMMYYSQYGSMNNYGMRNKIPMPPHMAYMSQPVWSMMADPSMAMGMANTPYMMGPNQMNQGMMEMGNNGMMGNERNPMTEPNTQGGYNGGVMITENQNQINMENQEVKSNNNNEMKENYSAASEMPLKNIVGNHQEIEFTGIVDQNTEQNCIASAVESKME